MARIKRRGESGAAKNYVTRNQAIRKLQISLADFRKLCIWKGIYPREPRSKKKVSKSSTSSTTFYYYKDIQFLLHEPLLQNFRDQKALEKKISKALGRGDVKDAARLDSNAAHPEKTGKSHYTLDHIVRERYPTFVDALRDLDDCLSMLFLFASLPSTSSVPAKMIARCERLCLEFQHYAIVSHSLTKSFLSIKGIYYQVNIQGEEVLWLAPYKFTQRVVGDVDYRIMGTFVEFYMTLLSFVNFRLYTSIGLKYPPRFDLVKDENAAELGALTLEGKTLVGSEDQKQLEGIAHRPDPSIQAAINKVVESLVSDNTNGKDYKASKERDEKKEQDGSGAIDKFEAVIPGGDVLLQPSTSSSDRGTLFSDFTFYLSRETPRQPLEFILKAFGCKRVGWDATLGDGAFTTDEFDASITHQIVDRAVIQAASTTEGETEDNQTAKKLTQNQRIPGRTYIQPQWVWDSINDCELKESHMYAPGASLPPHISPFVKSVPGAYDPTLPLEDQEMNYAAFDLDSDGEVGTDDAGKGMDVTDDDDKQDDDKEDDEPSVDDESAEADEEDEDPDDENEAAEREEELKAEMTGVSIKPTKSSAKTKDKNDAHNSLSKKSREEMEDINRAKGMLSKKKRKLFEQMQYTNNKKNVANEKLLAKRRRLEKDKAKKL